MKRRTAFYKGLAASIAFCLFSCASAPEKKIDSIYVMAYDYDNNEVMNAAIFLDGEEIGKTDIYGRLIFPNEKEKEALVRAEKPGYETVETKTMLKPGVLLYFKMGSGLYYAERAERLFDEGKIQDALKSIEKALLIDDRKDWRFLKEVILRREKGDE